MQSGAPRARQAAEKQLQGTYTSPDPLRLLRPEPAPRAFRFPDFFLDFPFFFFRYCAPPSACFFLAACSTVLRESHGKRSLIFNDPVGLPPAAS